MVYSQFILACVPVLVFIIYNVVSLCLFGVPCSLSNTYYLYEQKHKGLGWLFTAMMWTVGLTMLPNWLIITDLMTLWSHNFMWLPFLACGSICFVGAAPKFKDWHSAENMVHMIGAGAAAVFSLLWCFIICFKLAWWIMPCCCAIVWCIAYLSGTVKKGRDYWLEMCAFSTTFVTYLLEEYLLNFW